MCVCGAVYGIVRLWRGTAPGGCGERASSMGEVGGEGTIAPKQHYDISLFRSTLHISIFSKQKEKRILSWMNFDFYFKFSLHLWKSVLCVNMVNYIEV